MLVQRNGESEYTINNAMCLGGVKMDGVALGQRISDTRKKLGWTQGQLAEKAGIASIYVGEIERGLKAPSMMFFIKLIEALGASADYMLRYDVSSGKKYVYEEITEKMKDLTPKQRKTVEDILDAYISNLD